MFFILGIIVLLLLAGTKLISSNEVEGDTGGFQLGEGEKAPEIKTDYKLLERNIVVLGKDDENLWASGTVFNDKGDTLFKSSDLGETWEEVYKFENNIEGIHISKINVLFVSTSLGRWEEEAKAEVYRSENSGVDFEKVLDVESGAAINWNFASDDEGYVYISEYGYKNPPNNARRIYRSSDNGKNFEVVYKPEEQEEYHNHAIGIDSQDNNIIYQAIGDLERKIIISKDRGETWETLIEGMDPTSILDLGDTILFGLDSKPKSGIVKYDKASGEFEYALEVELPYGGSIYDMVYKNGVVYAGLLSYDDENHTWPGSVFISKDEGETWEPLVIWPKLEKDTGVAFSNFIEKDGYIFINSRLPLIDSTGVTKYAGTLRLKAIE